MLMQHDDNWVWTRRRFAALGGALVFAALGCSAEVSPAGELGQTADEALGLTAAALARCGRSAVPPELAVPAGHKLAFVYDASGDQIYTCAAAADGTPAWVLKAPDAELFDNRGRIAGTHYAGPTWESNDGSTVVATRLAGVSVDATAIPWLLLQAISNTGEGRMSKVTYIQRIATEGGLAPTVACTIGVTPDVPVAYTATYTFYEAKKKR